MQIIDADTHIDETEATWEYLRDFEQEFKPTTEYPSRTDPRRATTRYWRVDGHRQMRFTREVDTGRGTQKITQDTSTTMNFYVNYSHSFLGLLSRWIFLWVHTALWSGLGLWLVKRKDEI